MKKKENKFLIKQTLDNIYSGKHSLFLNSLVFNSVVKELNKNNFKYSVYEPFPDSDYKIIYTRAKPKVICLKINSYKPLVHQAIMGSLYALNINEGYFGDIIAEQESYVFILKSMVSYIKDNLNYIGSNLVTLEETNLKNYERKYLDLKLLVPSLRLDIVVSKICHVSRNQAKRIIINDDVLVNYNIQNNISYILKDNDVFFIKKIGKFKYIEIINKTKGNNLVILVKQYI